MRDIPLYKIQYGYGNDMFIQIEKQELLKFHYAMRLEGFFVGKYGGVNTKNVMAITPDYKSTYQCAEEYKLVGEDYSEIRAKHGDIAEFVGVTRNTVRFLYSNNIELLDEMIKKADEIEYIPKANELLKIQDTIMKEIYEENKDKGENDW